MSSLSIMEAAEELMDEYAERIDANRLEEWLDLFTEDATYQVVSRENLERGFPAAIVLCANKDMIRDRISALRSATKYSPHQDRHLVGRVRVTSLPDNRWALRASYAVYQTSPEGRSQLFSVGRYLDTTRMEGGRLLFCEKKVVVDTFCIAGQLATPL
jgi:anthranilate 1,2-dioxygenase small subunit